jgi:hypothetical protein
MVRAILRMQWYPPFDLDTMIATGIGVLCNTMAGGRLSIIVANSVNFLYPNSFFTFVFPIEKIHPHCIRSLSNDMTELATGIAVYMLNIFIKVYLLIIECKSSIILQPQHTNSNSL